MKQWIEVSLAQAKESEDKAMERIKKKMKIVHINGSLGDFNPTKFGKEQLNDPIISEMKTVWDNKGINSTVDYHMSGIDRIFFLGFGYLEENMRKLILNCGTSNDRNILAEKQIYGTAYGKTDAEINRIYNIFNFCGNNNPKINKDYYAKNLIIDYLLEVKINKIK